MAKHSAPREASWALVEELLQRGDPAFVEELRRLTDADRLGTFAARWYADTRPAARRLLFDYLDRPLNAFRHDALVKRLFKLAERAEDDEVMARFLVFFDRSVRRVVRKVRRYDVARNNFSIEEVLAVPQGSAMWRPHERLLGPYPIDEATRTRWEKGRLFSTATRRYLRRRAWRYFRLLGKRRPERYVPALAAALKCYRDEDVADGLALLDNWGLVHALFHHCPALSARPRGWVPAPGRSLRELAPAPIYEPLWLAAPRALLDLVREARCRPVRQWALHLVRHNH